MNVKEQEKLSNLVCLIIEKQFKEFDESKLNELFRGYLSDKRSVTFTNYYHETVLDKQKINFGTFSYQWALHLRKKHIEYLDENYELIRKKILEEKDIYSFFRQYGIDQDGRQNKSFCCKLFHTFLPKEFIPLDNPIMKNFKTEIKKKNKITEMHFLEWEDVIRHEYIQFSSKNKSKINLIIKLLLKKEFSFFRVNELSDIRLLDLIYWYNLNRKI
ncbi:MAG: hypothetical protein KKF65_07575 [Nanoarchaeota archaeon]|nr:hypothetical protein [Nanoarchaeota archaeon]